MTPPERRDFADAALWVLVPVGLLVVLLTVLLHAVNAPTWFWNGARLAPTIALAQGYGLYQPADSGPILDTIYGPVTALVYLPAAFATTPSGAIFIAALIVSVFSTLPMLALALRQAGNDPRLRAWGLFGFVLFYCALFVKPGCTVYTTSMVHADAPSLGLALLACLPLYRVNPAEAPGWRALSVSALLAVLSVWSKQTSVFVPVALAVYLLLAWGAPCLRRYLLCLLAGGGGLSLVLVAAFGPGPLFFNLFSVPAAQPWNTPLLDATLELGGLLVVFAPVLLLALYFNQRVPGSAAPSRGAWWRTNPWGMLLLLTAFAVPTALLSRMKVGGAVNNQHPLFFLIGAIALALPAALAPGRDPWLRLVGKRLQLVLGAVLLLLPIAYLASWDGRYRPDNEHQQAYDFARSHPGKAWFPSHPLSTLLAEGKLYHFEYGVIDRGLAGRAPTAAHIRAHIPPRLDYVIFHRDRPAQILLRYLPAFGRRVSRSELPDWEVYARRRS